jgi:hypothetical protein
MYRLVSVRSPLTGDSLRRRANAGDAIERLATAMMTECARTARVEAMCFGLTPQS